MPSDRRPKILCVDDEPKNLKLLEAILSPIGYEVIFAESGNSALESVGRQQPDIILLDIMLPGMSGYEVLEKLRLDKNFRLIPVVMITALHEMQDRLRAINAGCDDFISKPFDKNEVLARVKALLKISYYRSLLDEKEKFENVIENIEDGIVVLDNSYRIVRANKKAKALLSLLESDCSADFFVCLKKYAIRYPGDLSLDLKAGPLVFDIERPQTENFKSLIVEAHSNPIVNPAGEIGDILLTLHDVSAVRGEERLKQDFLSLISHKLRTPVSIITQDALILQEGMSVKAGEDAKKLVDAIARNSSRLTDLVENLLSFTAINSANLNSPQEPLEISAYLPKIAQETVKRAKEKKVELKIDCPVKGITINMYRVYFNQLIGNLIDNAIKFNDKDTVNINICVTAGDGKIKISIQDNGPGIPFEEQKKIFEKFYQIEKYYTGQVKGAGLGLALAKRIAEAYGGSIEVNSDIGRGAKFTVSLPFS